MRLAALLSLFFTVFVPSGSACAQERAAQQLRLTRVGLVASNTPRRLPVRAPTLVIAPTRAARRLFDAIELEPWVRARRMGLRVSARF